MDGVIVINKQTGCTSHDIVYKVKKLLNEKVGHTGTLDPMAEGVLPILVGKGTLVSKYLINHDKKYIATLQLGIKTDTADSEGKIIEEQPVDIEKLTENYICNVFKTFIGKQEQLPPMYSAIKVHGKKLYEYARKGQNVEIQPRQIEIYNMKLLDINIQEKQIKFEISCGKGTYIRSVCEDIAKKLDTVGYMLKLKRTQVGKFNIEKSITIKELKENIEDIEFLKENFISIERLFENKGKLIVPNIKKKHFLNGVKITQKNEDGIYRIYTENNEFLGIGVVKNNLLKRDIIL
ncbi:tRNA pseudouridine synthase B [Clostridium sp. CAG:575]|nr:tRNA pseudouridine synthase B [Clostridium sp. CAG:575]